MFVVGVDGSSDGPEVGPAELHALAELRRVLFGHEPPRTFDRYEVIRELGVGGLGLVYEGHDPKLDRAVAIKVVRSSSSKSSQARLVREAHALAKLNHPNVVAIYDVGRFDLEGRLGEADHRACGVFLVMELVDGPSLDRWLEAEPRSQAAVLEVGLQVGRGIAAAHSVGVLHRDIKPQNIVIGSDGRARVLDFGLARASGSTRRPAHTSTDSWDESSALTRDGTVVGTPGYMAPEQLDGGHVDERTDQFALCVTLFRALHGRPPFAGKELDDRLRAMRRHDVDHPPVADRASARVYGALVRGMHPDPARRWPSVSTLLAELSPPPRRLRRPLSAIALATLCVLPWIGHDDATAPPCSADLAAPRVEAVRLSPPAIEALGPQHRVRIEAALREAAEDLKELHEASCGAAAAGVPTAVLDDRRECLARGLAHLDRARRLASEARREQAFEVPRVVGELAAAAACAEQAVPAPPPKELLEPLRALQKETLEASNLLNAGGDAEAVKRLYAALERAKELGYAPVVAETLTAVAWAERRTDPEAAARRFEDAYWVAVRASAFELAAAAAGAAALNQSDRDAEQAAFWIRHGRALSGRYVMSPHVEGSLLLAEARVAEKRGDPAGAERGYDRVLANYGAHRDVGNPSVVTASLNRLNAIAAQGRLDEAETGYRSLIADLDTTYGADHRWSSTVRLSLAQHLQAQGRNVAELLDELESSLGDENFRVALQRLRADIARDAGELERAQEHRRDAIEILEASGRGATPEVEGERLELAELQLRAGDLDGAQASVVEARAALETMGRVDTPPVLGALANIDLARGQPDRALERIDAAMATLRATAAPPSVIASARTVRGEALLAAGRAGDAVDDLREALSVNAVAAKRVSVAARNYDALARALAAHEGDRAEIDALVAGALDAYAQAGLGWQPAAEALRHWHAALPAGD